MPDSSEKTTKTRHRSSKERQFKGMSLSERQHARREQLIAAGIETYGKYGFFSVTVKDVCIEAKLTERYFYESFKKSEDLFQSIFLRLIANLQQDMMHAAIKASPDPVNMIDGVLGTLLSTLQNDPRLARIVYIDALLVQDLHNQATIQETMLRFDRMIQAFVMLMIPDLKHNEQEISLIASGLNGYVTHIAIRWVSEQFKQPLADVLSACRAVFLAMIHQFSQGSITTSPTQRNSS